MKTAFTPEDLKINGPEGLQFSDAYGLTCAQLGVTVTKLLEIQPKTRFTQEDLIGYHFVQYGMEYDITKGAIELAQSGAWRRWEGAQALKDALPTLLDDETTGALTQRIRLGKPQAAEHLQLDPSLNNYFEAVTETDHSRRDVVSLYPKEDVELEYRGRASLHIGSVAIGNFSIDLTTYSDVLDISAEDDPFKRTVVISSASLGATAPIQSLRLI